MRDFLIMKRASECTLQNVNCALKVETFNSTALLSGEIYLTASASTKFLAYLKTKDKTVRLLNGESLKFQREFLSEDLSGGFTAVIVDAENFSPLLYCDYKGFNYPYLEIIEEVKNYSFYDDEKISTVNYYEGENYETKRIYNDDDGGDSEDKKSPPKDEASSQTFLHEDLYSKREVDDFYSTVKDRFDKIIYCYPKDTELSLVIPSSEFVKIQYDENRFYLVGRIFEGEKVKYLCYAVKGDKAETPKEISPYYKFIPLSSFDLTVGYYVIFQSAESGKIV